MTLQLRGLYTAIVTPFTLEDQSIDFESLENIIEAQISAGVDGIVALGSTGESATLSHEEHQEMIEVVVDIVAGRTHVIAGTGSNSTAEAISLTRDAAKAGVDASLVITPYGNKPPQRGLVAHFEAVANAVDLPLILYNIPGRTGVYLEPETTITLSEHPNIIGIKDASSEFDDMRRVVEGTRGNDFTLLSGNDDETLHILELGGVGSIAVTSNILPGEMKNMVHRFLDGDVEQAQKINQELQGIYNNLFTETNPIPIKALMAHAGFCENELRLPLVSMDEIKEADMIKAYRAFSL